MAMSFDELFVDMLRKVPAIETLCGSRVYHLEVYQNTDRLHGQYPCIVYQIVDGTPHQELCGGTGLHTTTIETTIIAQESSVLRAVIAGIDVFNSEQTNENIYAASNRNIEGVEVVSDSELTEFAIEQQDKGMKTAVVNVLLTHWGKQ